MASHFEIKGVHDGLLIIVGDGEWAEIRKALLDQIETQSDFFRGADLSIDVGKRVLKAAELGSLRDRISEYGVTLRAVISKSSKTEETAQTLGLRTYLSRPQAERSGRAFDTSVGGDEAVLVKRTLRSGNSITYPGHVVILGDVNPGAEIIAGGDVIVWGRLRGTVHAGASGDEDAIVCALELAPMQLRICEEISITPPQKGTPRPEVARLKDGKVVAEGWEFPKVE
ncbi:MAG: septum site-determining protein MinC [Chloroflexi bacterium]|nr:septum site-determining protein MinC [Chloroflexota bacterium]